MTTSHATLKHKAIEELKKFWLIALYLSVFFMAFTFYRRLVLAEFGVTYLHYGVALVQALVIGKVVLIGRALGLGKRFDRGPLIVSIIFTSIVFAVLVILFGLVEHIVEGLFPHKTWPEIRHSMLESGVDELMSRVLMLVVSFVPFFSLVEIAEEIGWDRMTAIFFSHRRAANKEPSA